MGNKVTSLVTSVCVAAATLAPAGGGIARADVGGPEEVLDKKIAVWRFDSLGIDAELVARLENLFRLELDRLDKQPLTTRREIERAVTAEQRNCTGEEKCLAAIGKKLGVDIVVTGTVGQLGNAYVLDIKAVDAATAKQVQRISSDPLRGSPDELIDSVRVAAYKLLAPDQLHGAIQVQSDLIGAAVFVDGNARGKTPLPNLGVVPKMRLGRHKLRVEAAGYAAFEEEVDVRFQKVSQVLVRLLPSNASVPNGVTRVVAKKPIYTKTWFIVGASLGAVLVGGLIGYAAGRVKCVDGVTGAEIGC
ncbi:MAG: PEGA domain-containing protein [Deltaproteobacteria bacterium]|nr:PEGA domain-containing protein [Deltaproteobacteria bacterium]